MSGQKYGFGNPNHYGFSLQSLRAFTLNGYQRVPLQITEFVNDHYIGGNVVRILHHVHQLHDVCFS